MGLRAKSNKFFLFKSSNFNFNYAINDEHRKLFLLLINYYDILMNFNNNLLRIRKNILLFTVSYKFHKLKQNIFFLYVIYDILITKLCTHVIITDYDQ